MYILPVLDLMAGRVVRGVAGRRAEYQPVVSRLTASAAPLAVARAFREGFGLNELYVADLDAILGGEPAFDAYRAWIADGFRLWIDAGVRGMEEVRRIADADAHRVVIGLETLRGPAVLAEACVAFGRKIVFSLDLQEGKPLGDAAAWETADPAAIADRAVAVGVRRIIVLDLARVGVAGGIGTEDVCGRLTAAHPDVEVIAGGGVRDPDDLRRLAACGVRTVLVASALHDGRLTRADCRGGVAPPLR